MTCPSCGSTDTWRDEVDIGVGIQEGPWRCSECGWAEEDQYDFPGEPVDDDDEELEVGYDLAVY